MVRAVRREECFGGTRVRYFVYTPDGEVTRRAAFVCSMIGDARCWDKLCRRLAGAGVLCVTIELPGFGTTPTRAPQDNITRSRIFWGVLDDVELSRGETGCRWHLISHGGACGAILEMAAAEPDSVISRTFISPVTDRFQGRISRALTSSGVGLKAVSLFYRLLAENRNRFEKKIKALYGKDIDESRMSLLYREFVRKGRVAALLSMFRDGYTVSDNAYKAQGRIMLIWGNRDRVFGVKLPEKYQRELPETEFHLLPCAHMAMETNPNEVGDYLSGWFEFTEGRTKQPKRTDI